MELEKYWNECKKVINSNSISEYFDPSHYDHFYNEVPLQFKDEGKMIYGIIDRIVIKDNTATIIDYKTHPYVNKENVDSIAKKYQPQMQLYRKGVKLLWPEYNVTSALLFTSITSLYEI